MKTTQHKFIAGFILVLPFFATLLGCGGSNGSNSDQPKTVLVETIVPVVLHTVVEQPIQTTIELPGNFLPRRFSRIVPEIEGVIESIPSIGTKIEINEPGAHYSLQLGVIYGLQVKKGQLLAQIDTSDLQNELQIAKASLAKANADLEKLKSWRREEEIQQLSAMRDQAQAQYDHAKAAYDRIAKLFNNGSLSVSEHDKAKMNVATAKATLDSADANLNLAKAGPTKQEIAVLQAAVDQAAADVQQKEEDIKKASIYAPYDGVITAMNVEVGERVAPSLGPIAEIMDLQFLVAEIGVPEEFRKDVKIYDRATVTVTGSDEKMPGIFVAINDLVAPETRTFKARVAIDNQLHKIKAGQFAKVQVSVGNNDSQSPIAIPTGAIQFIEGHPCVFVYENDVVKQRTIKIGVSANGKTEVVNGLSAGEKIVLDDPALVTDGMKVKVKNDTREPATETNPPNESTATEQTND